MKLLKPEELSVLELLCLGKTDKDIAFILGVTTVAVRKRVSRIILHLDAHNRTQAVAKFLAPHLFTKGV